jgi:hypothetical protein
MPLIVNFSTCYSILYLVYYNANNDQNNYNYNYRKRETIPAFIPERRHFIFSYGYHTRKTTVPTRDPDRVGSDRVGCTY